MDMKHIYGPVPSRRLGRSLGIDLVPFKTCTYDCIYCQLGRTTDKTVNRREYTSLEGVTRELRDALASRQAPDYISLAGSGEPTLHAGIGPLIEEIRRISHIPVAAITNGSLLWLEDVRRDLMEADVVMPSLDAGDADSFSTVNRPHVDISFDAMVEGIVEFTSSFRGRVWLEVFLLAGITDGPREIEKLAEIIDRIGPARVHLNTVSRPPACPEALPVPEPGLREISRLLPGDVRIVTDVPAEIKGQSNHSDARLAEIVDLLRRRPCTIEGVSTGLGINPPDAAKMLQELEAKGMIRSARHEGSLFYQAGRIA